MFGAGTPHADNFGDVGVHIVGCAVLDDLALSDARLDRPGVIGRASICPSPFASRGAHRRLGAVLTALHGRAAAATAAPAHDALPPPRPIIDQGCPRCRRRAVLARRALT
jgi:hypothetical protein